MQAPSVARRYRSAVGCGECLDTEALVSDEARRPPWPSHGVLSPPSSAQIVGSGNQPPVWPDPEGEVRGVGFEPRYKVMSKAARKDPVLYELLALVDALREVWVDDEVPSTYSQRLSTRTGPVYMESSKLEEQTGKFVYDLTALDFRMGKPVWEKRLGAGFSFDGHYPRVEFGLDGTVYMDDFPDP
jgi:hypothetical protein